jgi:hypothetical protein
VPNKWNICHKFTFWGSRLPNKSSNPTDLEEISQISQKLNHLVKEVKCRSMEDLMEGGNEQSKRIRHPLADVSLEHAERFENMGPISGPAYGSMSMGSYEAATVVHWLYLICKPRFIVVYDEQSLVNEDQDGDQLQPVHVCL